MNNRAKSTHVNYVHRKLREISTIINDSNNSDVRDAK